MTKIVEITDWIAKQKGFYPQNQLEGSIETETKKAILLTRENMDECWIPKSQIESIGDKPPQLKKISEVGPNDLNVRILGKITSLKNEDNGAKGRIDDGTNEMLIMVEDSLPKWVEKGQKVELWGTPLKIQNIYEFHVDEVKKV